MGTLNRNSIQINRKSALVGAPISSHNSDTSHWELSNVVESRLLDPQLINEHVFLHWSRTIFKQL